MAKSTTPTVTISQSRYEKLVDIESRCQVLIDFLVLNESIETYDIFTILGANEIALDIKTKEDESFEELLDKIKKSKLEVSAE